MMYFINVFLVAMMSILDAATNDLAQLINNLDLEATPGTPDMTPLDRLLFSLQRHGKFTQDEASPTKKSRGEILAQSKGASKELAGGSPRQLVCSQFPRA